MNTVLEQVKTAYADCWMDSGFYAIRQLEFKASEAVPPDEAEMIARCAIPDGYNAFRPHLLGKFPPDCQITFAREYSVCLYVTPGDLPLPTDCALGCDEYDFEDGILRVWWD